MADAKSLAFVVDDEEVIAKTLTLILNGSGFEAVAFTQPLEALRAAQMMCLDFLITDVSMPLLKASSSVFNSRLFIQSAGCSCSLERFQLVPSSRALYKEVLNSQSLLNRCIRLSFWQH
jgi:CheY-like chemotaxis protein